jgi:hypothetical protein
MRTWNFLLNPFLNATKENYKIAKIIGSFHVNALEAAKADPEIAALLAFFKPLYVAYESAYNSWIAQNVLAQAETLSVGQLLALLMNPKIREWDVKIQNQYPINTYEYVRLLPNRRKPFQNGGQVERITAVDVLLQNIGADTKLAELKTEIQTFYDLLVAASKAKQGSRSTTKGKSTGVESMRIDMGDGMFSNLGALMKKYYKNPLAIEQFFDLETMRTAQQKIFTGTLKPGEAYTIVKHTFDADEDLSLNNTGSVPLKFYLSNLRDAMPGEKSVTVAPGEQIVMASALGDLANTFLTVFNADTVQECSFEIELL